MKNTKASMTVYGFGIKDLDSATEVRAIVDGRKKAVWKCPFYKSWSSMIERCYSPIYQSKHPTYVGCSVVPEWQYFSAFKKWMESQNYEGRHLDKDILVPGNKVYGPDYCVFVSAELNNFLTDNKSRRGQWPIGVSWRESRKKFRAQCGNPITGKYETLGSFDCPDEAHMAWKKRKIEIATQWHEVREDPRVFNAIMDRLSKLTDDHRPADESFGEMMTALVGNKRAEA